ncbi:type II toxin-antitoxin system prevent-host-death family antitoxin [Aldersonia sp. NBC_00410]|uniref:type II toxin-antitoxin system Phd/YefM family antitoxin n=1 Tax=Aldersonia sp. NBC_00410 TaxID=2975954 RepID=UPI0022538A3A|nr:type II toxin-antitoxin system prevent-host-death family antitoxin [Aldersonia sp. NBC_00410]MCX5041622.1 type II toxin-antitoxin system prevent-host-death family antitoxin [Aldersonia sp. NBC_00410]
MREMSASEASRNFAAVLDAVEQGETIVVTRSGRRVASIAAAPAESGSALAEVFARWRGSPALDADFADRVSAGRRSVSADLDGDPWNE